MGDDTFSGVVIEHDKSTSWKLLVRESNRTGELELEAAKPIPYDGVLRYTTESRAYVSYRKNSKFNLTPAEVVNYYIQKSDTASLKDQLYADAMERLEAVKV